MKKKIGRKIKEKREEQGLSQYMLASKAGLHQVIVRNIEAGETAYSIDSLMCVCNALDLRVLLLSNSCQKAEAKPVQEHDRQEDTEEIQTAF